MEKKKLSEHTKRRLTIRGVLSALIIFILVRSIVVGNYENAFVCILSLVLFCVPIFLEKQLAIDIPPIMEGIIYCFIFAAEILGEINSFYTLIPGWDTMLHTLNGFLVAAVGFCLVDLFNRSERMTFRLSPLFLSIVAFCFSMTVGVLWEFFEFAADQILHTDAQKDFLVQNIHSVLLNPSGLNDVVHEPIHSLVVNGKDWMEFPGGYIDIGLIDTMKDLMVNFIGAVIFSVIGFFYVKTRGKGRIASSLIPVVRNEKEKGEGQMADFGKVVENLKKRGYAVQEFATAKEAADYLNAAIDGMSVGFGGSATLDRMGLYDMLSAHNTVYWHWKQEKDMARKAAMQTDVYLTSANALAETGEIINIDGVGNRVASTLFGHQKVYYVIGENKLEPDFEKAVERARNVAAPQRAAQFGKKTPCVVSGNGCQDCRSPERVCRAMVVLWEPMMGMDAEVILIHENLGL